MLPLIVDVLILICLGVTIFYAIRLSTALNNFKAHRKEFERLMEDLSQNIAQAQNAMMALKTASKKTGSDLQDKISDAVALCDELQLMTEMGNRLANRLGEKSTTSSSSQSDGKVETGSSENELPSFFIKDPEFDEGQTNIEKFSPRDHVDTDINEDSLQSEAEKDLLKALQRNKKR